MLVLTRKIGKSIYIGDDIRIVVEDIKRREVKIRIEAPKEIDIFKTLFDEQLIGRYSLLILTRRVGKSIFIGDDIRIIIVDINEHQVKIGIEAPREIEIYREELYKKIKGYDYEPKSEMKIEAKTVDCSVDGNV